MPAPPRHASSHHRKSASAECNLLTPDDMAQWRATWTPHWRETPAQGVFPAKYRQNALGMESASVNSQRNAGKLRLRLPSHGDLKMQRTRFSRLAGITAVFASILGLGVGSSPAAPRAPRPTVTAQRASRAPAWFNQSQMVITSQGVMHRTAAARLGLRGTPLPTAGNAGGTQDPGIRR